MSVTNPVDFERSARVTPVDRQAVLRGLADQYPEELAPIERQGVERIAFNIGLVFDAVRHRPREDISVADLGGGLGTFSVGCAALGVKRSVLIDDFNDAVNHRTGSSVLDLHRRHGVEVISRDVVSAGIADVAGSFDVITSFDSMEHWHHSPKRLFAELRQKLNPGGALVLGVPNCVNLRKRLTGLFGSNKWSSMQEWYEQAEFRGHVREPDVEDLHYIARDMGLVKARVIGRNWQGYMSGNPLMRAVTRTLDLPLRLRPTLCSDLYLVAHKPRGAG